MDPKTSVPARPQDSSGNADFQIFTQRPDVRFLSKAVQPPSTVYVSVGDDLVASVASSQANEVVTFSYRLLRFDGELVLGQFQVAPASNRTVTSHQESLAEGFLLSVSCKAAVGTTRGQTFVRVFLTDPALGTGQPSYALMADYVTTQMAPAHPGGRVLSPVEGPGAPRTIAIPPPGAGGNWSQAVPANARWKLRSIAMRLQTSAVVANRYVTLVLTSGGFLAYRGGADKAQAASIICDYGGATVTPTVSPINFFGMVQLPPELQMLGGDVISSNVLNIDVADQLSLGFLGVEEWLDNV